MRPLSKALQEALAWFENGFAEIPLQLLMDSKPSIHTIHPTFSEWIQFPDHHS
jgi:hypothetical protein